MILSHSSEREPPPTAVTRSTLVPAALQRLKAVAEGEGDAVEHRMGQHLGIRLMAEPHHQAARPAHRATGVRSPER